MPFNSDSYHLNKHRREQREDMQAARALKARIISEGERYPGEAINIGRHARRARFNAVMARSYARIKAIKRGEL